MRLKASLLCLAIVVTGVVLASPSHAAGKSCGTGLAFVDLANDAAAAKAACQPTSSDDDAASVQTAASKQSKYIYQVVLACRPARISDTAGGEATNCSYAMTACSFRNPPSDEVLYWVQSRPRANPNAAWTTVNTMCGLDDVPPGVPAPPPIPTLGQIQTAFKQLPFSKPRVAVQPAGNVTLVNLPTYYRATWPNDAVCSRVR
ncbi:hypothetical protein GCM10009867_08300 [Pedococcus aerophilus]|uniref:Secreted protein n=2 Tax=Pedococcus aerophilus TaxID=436356 RepID=A0ABN3UH20_9MICO